ncbi:MAG TPA: hypothetical protein VM802_19730 [Chitinophaga sp.]|uniref:hypothetical protein n=1 Tax=Chitinophaga sp. TaxID=1869181 RepID=UPI002C8D59B9|nr:hypothetical protein [Chitinophaga sp.]HVI47117.1 hypothetical protein [Chitinophaga sp.]
MNKWMFLMALLSVVSGLVAGQQTDLKVDKFSGEWEFSKVEMKLYAQDDGRLLEDKVFTTTESTKNINGLVPFSIKFSRHQCIISHRNGIEGGEFRLINDKEFTFSPDVQGKENLNSTNRIPAITYRYRIEDRNWLAIDMPAAFYKDNIRGVAVRLLYTCYYQLKPVK